MFASKMEIFFEFQMFLDDFLYEIELQRTDEGL